jgi:pimeloyl-ACP methyl ester carboxylesterase
MFTSTLQNPWSWDAIIARNTGLLKPIVVALFVLIDGAARLSPGVYRRVLRVLRPAESAVRRLIVIAAINVVAKPLVVKPGPAGPIIANKGGTSHCSFKLFDPRKRFPMFQQRRRVAKVVPRFYLSSYDPRVAAIFAARQRAASPPPAPPQPVSDGLVDAARITRRLQALTSALDDLPRQAKRLARWRLRRLSKPHLRKMDVMRYGRAPGYRKQKTREIDTILDDCHAFACEAMKTPRKPDTS